MKELSLNILDVAKNSVTAGATQIDILVEETESRLTITIVDNGCGMSEDFVKNVLDPFTTTRTTRKVGLGLPLMRMEAQMAGGDLEIESTLGQGTRVITWFDPSHIDMPPLGDLVSTVITLIQGSPKIDFVFTHTRGHSSYTLHTGEIRQIMGGISLAEPEVLAWLTDFLKENESTLEGKR